MSRPIALYLLSACLLSFAHQECDPALKKLGANLAHPFQRALVYGGDPTVILRARFPGIAKEGNTLWNLESDAIEMLFDTPTLRNYPAFSAKYGMSLDAAKDVIDFYALMFVDTPGVGVDRDDHLRRTQNIQRILTLTDESIPASRRHLYYLINLTHKSVPEMAKELGIPEMQVRREAAEQGISFSEPFISENKLSQAGELLKQGRTMEQVANDLGVGRAALEFALHHAGLRNRGVSWSRILEYEGDFDIETSLLLRLHQQGLTHQEIADRLNHAAKLSDPGDPHIRTTSSVDRKLGELGLAKTNQIGQRDVTLPGYGKVKENGKLVLGPTRLFVQDHAGASHNELATHLDVHPTTLSQFMKRHHISLDNLARKRLAGKPGADGQALSGKDLSEKYAVQKRQTWFRFAEWVRAHDNQLPTSPSPKLERDAFLAQNSVYTWLLRNRENKSMLAKLPRDIALMIAEFTPQEQFMDHIQFEKWIRDHQMNISKPPSTKPDEISEEDYHSHTAAFRWMKRNADDEALLALLPEDVRAVVNQLAPPRMIKLSPKEFTAFVRSHGDELPKYSKTKSEGETEATYRKRVNAYNWYMARRNDPETLKQLPEDIRKKILAKVPQEKAMDAEAFDRWVITNDSALPPGNRTQGKDEPEETFRLRRTAYAWLLRNYDNTEQIKNLSLPVQALVKAYKPAPRVMNADEFSKWVMTHQALPKNPSEKFKPGETEASRKLMKAAYIWLSTHKNKPEDLASLPPQVQDLIAQWKASKKPPR